MTLISPGRSAHLTPIDIVGPDQQFDALPDHGGCRDEVPASCQEIPYSLRSNVPLPGELQMMRGLRRTVPQLSGP